MIENFGGSVVVGRDQSPTTQLREHGMNEALIGIADHVWSEIYDAAERP